MACTSLPKHPLRFPRAPLPKAPPSSSSSAALPKSSHSQIHGLKLSTKSTSLSLPPPSSGPRRMHVSAKAFAKKYRLPFTLLSDKGNKVRKQ